MAAMGRLRAGPVRQGVIPFGRQCMPTSNLPGSFRQAWFNSARDRARGPLPRSAPGCRCAAARRRARCSSMIMHCMVDRPALGRPCRPFAPSQEPPMPTTRSRLSPEIDLDGDGKQTGFLRLPHSVHRSAYGWVPIPIARISNGDGPRILLMAGNHGDEYEGQVALGRLIRELEPAEVRGHIIILPSANFPAAMAGTRTSPLDAGNLNRSFPGDPTGGPTAQIAYYIESELLPRCDFVLDIHSGGSSLTYLPSTLGRRPDTPEALDRAPS